MRFCSLCYQIYKSRSGDGHIRWLEWDSTFNKVHTSFMRSKGRARRSNSWRFTGMGDGDIPRSHFGNNCGHIAMSFHKIQPQSDLKSRVKIMYLFISTSFLTILLLYIAPLYQSLTWLCLQWSFFSIHPDFPLLHTHTNTNSILFHSVSTHKHHKSCVNIVILRFC